eukprot:TRINITY_DN10563_c0_g1_i3.p1 TRINITY_DN10563_c0_g1~~TRINITY_DN10563_c0_g1_i3.p1  ORF type:complete len:688 (+),score=125.57 TRINITY_DN10563_c0_g1_i3:148-2211(+)
MATETAEELYCICRTPYDEAQFMIECDACKDWFHGSCVGVLEAEASSIESYICHACEEQTGRKTVQNAPARGTYQIKLTPHGVEDAQVKLYCLCQQPYDKDKFYIECDLCQDWFHGRCVGIKQSESPFIKRFVCPTCEKATGKRTKRREQATHGVLTLNSRQQLELDQGIDYVARMKARRFEPASRVIDIVDSGHELSFDRLRDKGFLVPTLIKQRDGLELELPPDAGVDYVVHQLGPDYPLRVIDVAAQKTLDRPFTLGEWQQHLRTAPADRDHVYNVISLEFSQTVMSSAVQPPRVARQLDMLNFAWPTSAQAQRPQVQKYCLMGPEGAYTDFHVDLGGTSVWYHVLKGCKVFYLIPPSEQNQDAFEAWSSSTKQAQLCLADMVPSCYECRVEAGNTLLIPSGWIHAVYTPEDSFVFGGNYLHTLALEMQLKVYDFETKLSVDNTYRYPSFRYLHWHLAKYISELPLQQVHALTTVANLQALVAALSSWKSTTTAEDMEQLPYDVDIVGVIQLLRNLTIELKHHYPHDDYPLQSWQRPSNRTIKAKIKPVPQPRAKRPAPPAPAPKKPKHREAPKLKINAAQDGLAVRDANVAEIDYELLAQIDAELEEKEAQDDAAWIPTETAPDPDEEWKPDVSVPVTNKTHSKKQASSGYSQRSRGSQSSKPSPARKKVSSKRKIMKKLGFL